MIEICSFKSKKSSCIFYIHYLLLIWILLIDIIDAGHYEKKLLKDLFEDYNSLERPVEKEGDTVNVALGMSIQQIVDLDEKMQILTCSGWLDYNWYDYNFKWNPADYGNVTHVRVKSESIWVPDVLLYNSGGDSFDTTLKVNAVLEYTGMVKWVPPGMFKSTCQIDITDFPFDEQSCQLKFGSWSYDESSVNLTASSDQAQLDSFSPNGEWHLNGVDSIRQSIVYDCCPEKYPFVLFIVKIRRRTLYFIFNLVFPCALISMMTILGFALPPDSGEKIGLEITTLLSIVMFLQLITGIIPESSQAVPKICLYFALVMLICAIAIVCNVFVLVLHHRNVKVYEMPPWIKKYICIKLAKFLRIKNPKSDAGEESHSLLDGFSDKQKKLNRFNPTSRSLLSNVYDEKTNDFVLNDDFGIIKSVKGIKPSKDNNNDKAKFRHSDLYDYEEKNIWVRSKNCLSNSLSSDPQTLKTQLTSILNELNTLTKKIDDDGEEEDKELDWKFAAMVIDKLCLYVFTILTIVSTCGILFSAKNFFKFM